MAQQQVRLRPRRQRRQPLQELQRLEHQLPRAVVPGPLQLQPDPEEGTPLRAATVVGDTVGDPFKDTSSVAMNPVIKFTTLFGLLAVEPAASLTADRGSAMSHALAAFFFAISLVFVWRSFYGVRSRSEQVTAAELARRSAH